MASCGAWPSSGVGQSKTGTDVCFRPIAGGRYVLHNRGMSLLGRSGAVLLLLASCKPAQPALDREARSATPVAAIPLSNANINDAAYHLRVQRGGTLSWNGVVVDERTLKDYLGKFSDLPKDAGALSVDFEPGTQTSVADRVRRDVVGSGLCQQRRCIEMKWGTPMRVVN